MTIMMEKSWVEALRDELNKPYIQALKIFLNKERERGARVFPPEELLFNAFRQTPYNSVKVVIVGQDPYHGVNQAHGLCFSVQKGVPTPPSLRNIYKEMEEDLGIAPADHGCLESWAKQGVLLLNATLTVRSGAPKSHYGVGWERFTDAVIQMLCGRQEPLVFILWGRSAKEKCANILNHSDHPHTVLTAAHPSPFSATRFFGCRHFSKANEQLKKWGKEPINWSLNG
ncbi:MAG: Uracil-DNA glycosylase [Chlamydiae bacterium]|nr:Uracil-DNA glycosylase [Chlamydiota bacterium]